ncbi:MAG TPA: ATPase [Actinobacteria bacterium]|nr:ATPase [Actinomycetota bacterium]
MADPTPLAALPESTPVLDIDGLIDDPGVKVIVCCGSGGVGKTTTAASLGLRAAERGRKVCVMTIDPARRLAQSMGLSQLDNTPRSVAGVDDANGGSLDAMMLDMKRTFDEIVESHSDPGRAQAILENPFYQALSTSFAGTQEYMAMEKLGQLRSAAETTGEWDLIIVDTPPSRSALDFLDAPKRLGSFLDGRLMKLLSAPARGAGKFGAKVVGASLSVVTGTLTKVIGAQVLKDLQGFVSSFDALFGGFRQRAEATYAQLQAPDTRFLVVAAPERDALREASYFVERLAGEDMPLAGLILNRVQEVPLPNLSAETALAGADRLDENGEHPLTAGMLRLHADRVANGQRQRRLAQRFSTAHPRVPAAAAPALAGDVHDLDGLREVAAALADQ